MLHLFLVNLHLFSVNMCLGSIEKWGHHRTETLSKRTDQVMLRQKEGNIIKKTTLLYTLSRLHYGPYLQTTWSILYPSIFEVSQERQQIACLSLTYFVTDIYI